ncbi:MAG: ABC transporter permease [Alphaproteobacteria bacterium]|nr:ABC transporter permease [Alphaproteobacteria bacterium]
MKARWGLVLLPSFIVSMFLLIGSQYVFLSNSFYRDLRLGRIGPDFTWLNYIRFFSDKFYLDTLYLTIEVSAIATLFTLLAGYPVAYLIARMRSRFAMVMLAAVVLSSLISIVIKVLGIIVIFAGDGPINSALLWLGILDKPFSILGNISGVVIGLMHFTLGFGVLLLYSVIRTIPRSLEEAAQLHGASRPRMFWRVILPLSLPGVIAGGLIMFNLCMGVFVSAAILGSGKVLTLPVLIQRTIILENKYAMGATLAAILLVSALLVNLLSVLILTRFRASKRAIA